MYLKLWWALIDALCIDLGGGGILSKKKRRLGIFLLITEKTQKIQTQKGMKKINISRQIAMYIYIYIDSPIF
jgi:hypothetical protein